MNRLYSRVVFLFVFSLFLLFSVSVFAQDDEEDTIRNMRRSIALFLTQGLNESLSSVYATRDILDLGPLHINFQPLPLGSRIVVKTPHIPVFRALGFSTVLPNPYVGSPAYDIINTWRNSLNIDVVTGKYYWEW